MGRESLSTYTPSKNEKLIREQTTMPSFDVVIEVDKVELGNAVDQANKEISNRFDFKGSDSRVELIADQEIVMFADDEFKAQQVYDVLTSKMSKRGLDLRGLNKASIEKISGDKVKQRVTMPSGVDKELGKKIIKLLKDQKLKAQGSIQGDSVRISSPKRDTLQSVITLLKTEMKETPLQYNNFRD